MGIAELLLTAIALSMDAFAVAICKGLSMKELTVKKALTVGAYFGFFQALMPLIGYLIGAQFQAQIEMFDHWIAFTLLFIIGANMIREALKGNDENEDGEADLSVKGMLILAVSTSIDALAVGVTFAFLKTSIVPAISIIGISTFIISILGVKIGNVFGLKFKKKAEIAGGIVLILIGTKILLEHLGVISF